MLNTASPRLGSLTTVYVNITIQSTPLTHKHKQCKHAPKCNAVFKLSKLSLRWAAVLSQSTQMVILFCYFA